LGINALNQRVIVVPLENPAGIPSRVDLVHPGLPIVLGQAEMPARCYAPQSVCRMGTRYGADCVAKGAGNVVSEEDTMRAVVTTVHRGAAHAGIVSATDTPPSLAGAVRAIELPKDDTVPAQYPIAAVRGGHRAVAHPLLRIF